MTGTVLLLAYHYPPLGGVAVMRVLRFSRYLSEHGWKPIVMCVEGGARHEPRDEALVREIPSQVVVHRIPCFEPDNYSDSWDIPREKVVRNLFKTFDRTLFPDDRAFWIRPLVKAARRLLKTQPVDVIWATAQPWSTLVAGMRLKQATGLPLVLDFRDDWTTSNADFRKTKRLAEEKTLEQKVLAQADAVVSVTPDIVDQLKQRRPSNLNVDQFHYIPNGFDPAHFADRPTPNGDRFLILHAGGLYEKRPITPFLELLTSWFREHPERRDHVKVVLLGRNSPEVEQEIADSEHADLIEARGFVSHTEVRRLMMEASINLLMIERVKTAAFLFTGKVFEYIGARRPILMLGPDPSPLAALVRSTGLAFVYDYESWNEQASTALEQVFQNREVNLSQEQQANIDLYDARHQSGKLARIFEQVVTG